MSQDPRVPESDDVVRDQAGPETPGSDRPGSDQPGSDQPGSDTAELAHPGRFAVTTYVPPEPTVQFAGRRRRTSAEKTAQRESRRRRHRRRRIVGWSMIAAGSVLLLGGAWVAFRAYQAYDGLDAAAATVRELQDQLTEPGSIDLAAARGLVTELQTQAASARGAVDDPLYRAATVVPVVGPNLAAVGQVATTVDTLARDVMPALMDVATTLQPDDLNPQDGRIPLEPIEQISPALQQADRAIDTELAALYGIDRSRLVAPVADAVTELGERLQQAADVTDPAARVARLAPAMLGAQGPRTWLVVFQNPAELRATGGIFGSFALVRADEGKIEVVDRGASSRVLGEFPNPVSELTETEQRTFGPRMAEFPQDVNLTPDFPRAAELFIDMYTARTGTPVDGVVAVDPVVLSYLLRDAPPIEVDGLTLDSDNLVQTLLSTAYERFDSPDQSARDDFLSEASNRVFTAVMSGDTDGAAAINGLRQGVRERRVLIYSEDPVEHDDLAATDLAGTLDPDGAVPEIGVFLNDATIAKLGYYLHPSVRVDEAACRADGRRQLDVAVTLTSDAPSTDTPLPGYVLGPGEFGAAHGVRTNVLVAAPLGGGIVGAGQDGQPVGFAVGEDQDREVATVTVELLPGESKTVVVTVLGPVGTPAQDVSPAVVLTPGVHKWDIQATPYRVCRAPDGSGEG